MFCRNCGSELRDNDKFCTNCGAKVELSPKPASVQPPNNTPTENNSPHPIYNTAPPQKKKGCLSKIFTVFLILVALSLIGRVFGGGNSSRSGSTAASQKQSSASTPTPTRSTSPAPTKTPSPSSTPTSTPKPTSAKAEEVFYIHLLTTPSDYEDQYVETTFPISYINSSGDIESKSIGSSNIEVETGNNDYYKNKDHYKFVTVKGIVSRVSTYDVKLNKAEVVYIGETAPEKYTSELAEYTEQVRQGKIQARADFISSTEVVSYNELRRYPDTYKNKPLKLSLYITEVEADGLLTTGTIKATYNGGEIAVYDHREVREPRFKAGDSVVIYALGDGLTTIITYKKGTGILGSDIGAEVVSEREIPVVYMVYTDLDRLESFGLSASQGSNNDDDYYYNLGRQAAEKVNEWIAGG